jgi:hypothetical protein
MGQNAQEPADDHSLRAAPAVKVRTAQDLVIVLTKTARHLK